MLYRTPEDNRTIGDIWHEEVENENPVAAFLTFALGMLVVMALLFVLPAEANADPLTTSGVPTIKVTTALDKSKAKATSKASKAYSKYKSKMTKAQRAEYRKYVWKIDRAKTQKRVEKVAIILDKYVTRAKLVSKLKQAKKFSLAKAGYVYSWGKRVDKYLKGSPMRGTGYLTAKWAYDTKVDPRLSPAIASVESGKGRAPYGCKYNVWGWVWQPPAMYSWDDALGKWHKYFGKYFKGDAYPISSMHGYGAYGPWYVNREMAKI